MLIITRRLNERTFIDRQRIKITIVQVKGNCVRLGIEAPRDVDIYREEVWLRLQAEKGASS
jgi:carbon storage regulator